MPQLKHENFGMSFLLYMEVVNSISHTKFSKYMYMNTSHVTSHRVAYHAHLGKGNVKTKIKDKVETVLEKRSYLSGERVWTTSSFKPASMSALGQSFVHFYYSRSKACKSFNCVLLFISEVGILNSYQTTLCSREMKSRIQKFQSLNKIYDWLTTETKKSERVISGRRVCNQSSKSIIA